MAKTMAVTEEREAAETPLMVLKKLQAGNLRFLNGNMRSHDFRAQAKRTAKGQHPIAVIFSCIDSRSTPEILFDQGLGDIFVTRTAGNVINTDILGGLEFATKLSGARLIVVMAHTDCGAIKGACNDAHLGNLTELLAKIQPAVNQVAKVSGKKDCNDKQFINHIAEENLGMVMQEIKDKSPVITEMIEKHQVKLVGAVQDLKTGKVRFITE